MTLNTIDSNKKNCEYIITYFEKFQLPLTDLRVKELANVVCT
jgi:hypothetical protein